MLLPASVRDAELCIKLCHSGPQRIGNQSFDSTNQTHLHFWANSSLGKSQTIVLRVKSLQKDLNPTSPKGKLHISSSEGRSRWLFRFPAYSCFRTKVALPTKPHQYKKKIGTEQISQLICAPWKHYSWLIGQLFTEDFDKSPVTPNIVHSFQSLLVMNVFRSRVFLAFIRGLSGLYRWVCACTERSYRS